MADLDKQIRDSKRFSCPGHTEQYAVLARPESGQVEPGYTAQFWKRGSPCHQTGTIKEAGGNGLFNL
jgi:hypothetical protein